MSEILWPTSASEAVANGAQLLDEKFPDWWKLIDLDSLDISDCESCICGQLAGVVYDGLGAEDLLVETPPEIFYMPDEERGYIKFLTEELGIKVLEIPWAQVKRQDTACGFAYSPNWSWAQLDREWGKVVRARLEADKLPVAVQEREVVPA